MVISESKWTARICDELRNKGAIVISIVGGPMQMSGLPDRCLIHADLPKSVWLEFKGEHTILRINQKIMMANMNRVNEYTAFILRYPGSIQYSHYGIGGRCCDIIIGSMYRSFNDARSLISALRDIHGR